MKTSPTTFVEVVGYQGSKRGYFEERLRQTVAVVVFRIRHWSHL